MIPFPDKKYNIIYADPPWKYWDSGDKNQAKHYDCMPIDAIAKLKVKNIMKENCILFMWVTFPILHQSFKIIESWGFKYSTCGFVWVKTNKNYNINQSSFLPYESLDSFWGLGSWTRSNVELCLIAKKGKIERKNKSIHQIIYEPVREHSRKPDCIRDKIAKLCGDLPRIELFARQKVEGWDCWGNEV